MSVYNTSKAGVSGLTRSLAVEWGPRGLRINTVSPGHVATPRGALETHMHPQWTRETVLCRFAEPVEIPKAVEYFLGEESAFCCSTELLVAGGFSLR
jgi:NAD(P)-dependent dehydrogenase (short-subunit alcohol dehydrogenase family)